jgi:hypothetical protein
MFKKFREMRELKKTALQYQVLLLGKVYNFVEGLPDIIELAKRFKDMDMTELQKNIATELVKYIKANEDSVTKVDNEGK